MPTATTPLLAALTAWPAGPGRSAAVRRATAGWADDPVLCRFPSPAVAPSAVGHPATGPLVLTALAARPDDPVATTAALAGLAPRLVPIVGRWARAGLAGSELEGAEADLVAECLIGLRGARADLLVDPAAVVAGAWHRVCADRRTLRARAARTAPGDPELLAAPHAAGRSGVETVMVELTDAARSGRLGVDAARALAWQAAGWSSVELADRTGIPAATLRARRSRARRRLAAPAGV